MDLGVYKNVDIEFKLDKKVFERDGFMIARVKSKTKEIKDLIHPIYGNCSVKGKMPDLRQGLIYKGTIENVESSKYGYTLAITNVYPRDMNSDNINTDESLVSFIEVFIGIGTADKIRNTKGICQMVKNEEMDKLTKIKGVGQATAKKIIETYNKEAVGSKFLIKLKKLGFTDREIARLSELFENNLLLAYEQVKSNIFSLVYNGFQLGRMDAIYLEKLNGDKKNITRINTYLWKALKDAMYEKYKSYLYLSDYYNLEIVKNISANVGDKTIQQSLKKLEESKRIKIIDNNIITTYEEFEIETNLTQIIEEITETVTPRTLPIKDIDKEIEEQEEIIGFRLNEGQRKAVKDIISSRNPMNLLLGSAGTGKTTVTKVILNIYAKYDRDNFILCALSGRASSVLGESSGYPHCANTIHRTLGRDKGTGGWGLNYFNKFPKSLDVLIIDEISMVDYFLLYSILAPVNEGLKIIVLGDSYQLPSLSFGKPIETLQMFDINVNELTQVMRQSEDSYILAVANDIRVGKNPFENTKYRWMGVDTEVCIGDSYNYMIKSFVEKFRENPNSTIVATTTKAHTDRINFDIQKMLIREKLLKETKDMITKPSSTKGEMYKIYIGDYIMILKNNYNCTLYTDKDRNDFYIDEVFENADVPIGDETSVFNGEIYKVKDIFDKHIIITDGEIDILVEHQNLECQLAYASNVHKLQGSTVQNVFVYTTSSFVDRKMITSREWLYTAVTRSKKLLCIHTDEYTNLSGAIRRKAINEKITLIEYFNK